MKFLLPLLALFFLFSCGNSGESAQQASSVTSPAEAVSTPEASTTTAPASTPTAPEPAMNFVGSYTGYFEASEYADEANISWANLITVFMDSLVKDQLYGHSVVAGNARPFQGSYTLSQAGTLLTAEVQEPGDDRYDGTFSFSIDSRTKKLIGTWKSYKKLSVSGRKYELNQRDFVYKPGNNLPEGMWAEVYDTFDEEEYNFEMITEAAAYHNASTQKLTKDMVENMHKGDLEVMRNAIYARHGYSFKNRRMRYIFDSSIPWYMPVTTDIRDQLTPLEKENIDLLKRYEQHATAYYDSFGR